MSLKVGNLKETFFNEIYKLEPLSIFQISGTEINISRYNKHKSAIKKNDVLKIFSDLLESSVKRCTSKDARIGLMLSGGLDSSAVALTLRNLRIDNVITMSGNGSRHLTKNVLDQTSLNIKH